MKPETVVIFLALAVTVVSGQSGRKLDEPCTNITECLSGLICSAKHCKCPKGEKLTGYNINNTANCVEVIGASCEGHDDCYKNMDGAKCEDKKCFCPAGMIGQRKECSIEIKLITDKCVEDSQCKHAFGEFSICKKNDRCICKEEYYFNDNPTRCVKSKGLLEDCYKDEECYLNVNNKNALSCRQESCNCTEGFHLVGDTCKSGVYLTAASVSLMLFATGGILQLWRSSQLK